MHRRDFIRQAAVIGAGMIVPAAVGAAWAPRCFDPAINGMIWFKPETMKEVTSRIDWMSEPNDGYGPGAFLSSTRKEMLILERQHDSAPGTIGTIGFILAPKEPLPKMKVLENIESFRTGKGIRLGMTEKQVKAILGTACMKREVLDGRPAITYAIGGEGGCSSKRYLDFLKSVGLPDYAGSYVIEGGRVTKVWLESGQDY